MMSELAHEQIEELLASDALDGLDEAGRSELVRLRMEHGPDCAECLRLESAYQDVASHLATLVEAMPLSSGAEDTLMEAARTSSPRPGAPGGRRLRVIPGGGRVQRKVAAVAVAAAIALLG